MTISIKRCVLAVAIAALLPAVASAETVPLFDATPVTASGFSTNFASTFVFAESDPVTVYCVGDQTARVKDTNGGPPLVDNYMTAGDDSKSICLGGSAIQSGGLTTGTHCFTTANSTAIGGNMRTAFNGPNVTAPVSLLDGENTLTFKLWDYGVVYGNTPLELVLPEACSTTPQCWEDETAWSAGSRYVTRGNWATYTDISGGFPLDPVILYAAQNLEAGTVNFVNIPGPGVDIIIELNDGFRFAVDEDENLKIEGYGKRPSGNPSPGGFAFKSTESGKSATVNVPYFNFYGVHVDVDVRVDCPPATNLLSDGGFDSCTTAGPYFNPDSPVIDTNVATLNAWRAATTWACAEEGGDWYASQDSRNQLGAPLGDIGQPIKQGIDGALVPSGSSMVLSFDYRSKASDRLVRVEVYGLAAGQTWLPFPIGDLPLGACSDCVLLFSQNATVPATDWTTFTSAPFAVPADYAAIAVGIFMGGNPEDPYRGLDNVVLTIN